MECEAYRDETLNPPTLVIQVGCAQLGYALRCVDDLHAMLKSPGDWMLPRSAVEGTVEAWCRSPPSQVGGGYGLKKGLRGRFGVYVPHVLKEPGLAEVESKPKNNGMRAA